MSGRAVLRQLAGAILKVDPTELVFGYEPSGKPFLRHRPSDHDLRFNLSHSGRLVAVAMARGREVGVDIESIHSVDDWSLLTGRIFSGRELAELNALPASRQRQAFFNGWTRKEAYLKATGEGLSDALPSIEVTLAPENEPQLIGLPASSGATRRWAIRGLPMPHDYAGAVVFEDLEGGRSVCLID